MCSRKMTTLLGLTTKMLKQLQEERFVNPGSEMPSFLVKLFSGAKLHCSKDKAYSIFFFPQTNAIKQRLSEIYYSLSRRHLEPGLPQTLCCSEEK